MRIAPFHAATPPQAAAALAMLHRILSADGSAPPEPVHADVLNAVARHFFRSPAPIAPPPVPPGPAEPAIDIPPALRRGVAELAALMPLADASMDLRKIDVADQVIAGLGEHVPQTALLRKAGLGQLQRLRLQVSGSLVRQLAGVGVAGAILQVLKAKMGLFRQHGRSIRAAASLPDGTLGREMLRYYADNPFAIPGEQGGFPPVLVGRHDYLHVLTGYDTSTEGELCLSGFVGACAGDNSRVETLMVGLLQFNQRVPVQEFAAEVVTAGALRPETYFLSIARGASCTADVADPAIDYLVWLDRDLDALRAGFGITAAGMMVHAAQPDWANGGKNRLLVGQRRRTPVS